MKSFWHHPWTVAVWNIGVLIILYTFSRLFFYWINIDMFPHVSLAHMAEMMRGGLRFDISAILYLSSFYLLMMILPLPWSWRHRKGFVKASKWVLWVPNTIGILSNCIDMVYVRFTDRRTSWAFFTEFENDTNIAHIILESMVQYWYVTLFFVGVMAVWILLTRVPQQMADSRRPWVYYSTEGVLCCVTIYFVVILIRGGFGGYTRPMNMTDALEYTNEPTETLLVLNTPFGLIRTTGVTNYHRVSYWEEQEVDSLMSPEHEASVEEGHPGMNVVLILLESFSKEHIGFYNHHLKDGTYMGYTPFLDSLIACSTTFTHSFANGRKSIDAMPSVISSLPMLIEPYVNTPYSGNKVSSLAHCLNGLGYYTSFFHGAPNGSMGFQAYAHTAGFKEYQGMDEYLRAGYPNAFDGTWAIWDEEFLDFYKHSMDTLPQPFFSAVYTASSHHPFRVPERYKGVFPQGEVPLQQCIAYSDHALSKFFHYASQQPWYEHTLFVITADHAGASADSVYCTDKGRYEIPIVFYLPSDPCGVVDSVTVMSQTDIMPTVLSYLGYDQPYFAFGESVWHRSKTHPYAVCYNHPLFQMMSDHLLLQFDGKLVTAIYDYVSDPYLVTNRVEEWLDTAEVQDMVAYLKAYIQQYVNRMIDNRLCLYE